jgi:hypothetical protein
MARSADVGLETPREKLPPDLHFHELRHDFATSELRMRAVAFRTFKLSHEPASPSDRQNQPAGPRYSAGRLFGHFARTISLGRQLLSKNDGKGL